MSRKGIDQVEPWIPKTSSEPRAGAIEQARRLMRTPSPLLFAGGEAGRAVVPVRSVMVGDASGFLSAESLTYAIEVAASTGASVHAVSVLQIPSFCEDHRHASQEVERLALLERERFKHLATAIGLRVEVTHNVHTGRPVDLLSRLVQDHGLLVIGRRQRPWADRALDSLAISGELPDGMTATIVVVPTHADSRRSSCPRLAGVPDTPDQTTMKPNRKGNVHVGE